MIIANSLLSTDDVYLFNEGNHFRLYRHLGSHPTTVNGVEGTQFAVWAPNAREVSVVGDFNGWNRSADYLSPHGNSGIWEGFVEGVSPGTIYKYHIVSQHDGFEVDKADPFAFHAETPPKTGSIVWNLDYDWNDQEWMNERGQRNALDAPISIYEVHLGSWMRVPDDGFRSMSFREIAPKLAEYVKRTGFTHVEFLPIMEHPFFGSWGYQTTGYFAPSSRYRHATRFHVPGRLSASERHRRDSRLGAVPLPDRRARPGLLRRHASLRTLRSTPGLSSRLEQLHLQLRSRRSSQFPAQQRDSSGLTSITPTDFASTRLPRCSTSTTRASRESGYPTSMAAGRISRRSRFLQRLNQEVFKEYPDVQTYAEESTAWPMVSRPIYVGGLGFGMKWDMGWMHDTLDYFEQRPDPPPLSPQ